MSKYKGYARKGYAERSMDISCMNGFIQCPKCHTPYEKEMRNEHTCETESRFEGPKKKALKKQIEEEKKLRKQEYIDDILFFDEWDKVFWKIIEH